MLSRILKEQEAFYPSFPIGCKPLAVPCRLAIVEAIDGKKYFRTPFAFLDHIEGDLERATEVGGGYYASERECLEYLAIEYPHAALAGPLMDAWETEQRYYGTNGGIRFADKIGMGALSNYYAQAARGHRSFTRQQIKKLVKSLTV